MDLPHAALEQLQQAVASPSDRSGAIARIVRLSSRVERQTLSRLLRGVPLQQVEVALRDLDPTSRGRGWFLAGLAASSEGRFDDMRACWLHLSSGSGDRVEAQLRWALRQVQTADLAAAIASLEALVSSPLSPAQRDLVQLDLARARFSAHDAAAALTDWQRVDPRGALGRTARFEQAWGHFARNEMSATLEDLDRAERLEGAAPLEEALVLRALSLLRMCRYDDALVVANAAEARLDGLIAALAALTRGSDADRNERGYGLVRRVRDNPAVITSSIRAVVVDALGDTTLTRALDAVSRLESEVTRYRTLPAAFRDGDAGARVLETLTLERSLAIDAAGALTMDRLERAAEELDDLQTQLRGVHVHALAHLRGAD